MMIVGLRCRCGADELISVDPGTAPQIDVVTDIMVFRGKPMVGWCAYCAPWRRGLPGAAGFQTEMFGPAVLT